MHRESQASFGSFATPIDGKLSMFFTGGGPPGPPPNRKKGRRKMHDTYRRLMNEAEAILSGEHEGYLTTTKLAGSWMRVSQILQSISNRIDDELNAAEIAFRNTPEEDNPEVSIELSDLATAIVTMTRLLESETQITVSDRARELRAELPERDLIREQREREQEEAEAERQHDARVFNAWMTEAERELEAQGESGIVMQQEPNAGSGYWLRPE